MPRFHRRGHGCDAIGEAWATHGGIRSESTYARTAHQFRVAGEPWASNSDAKDTDGPKIVAAVVEAALRTYACVSTTTTKSIWFQDHEPQAANRVGLDTRVFQAPLGALEAAAGATDGAAVHAGIPVPPANAVSVMCLAIRGLSLLRLAAGSISELALLIEMVIAASWPRGSSRPKSAWAGRAVDFQLHSTPWYWAEAGALEGRLYLDHNQFTGSIPDSLGKLTALTALSLNNNQLSGPIPSSLGNLAQLQSLDLSGNQLSGEVPSSLGSLTSLTALGFGTNQLSGRIPSSLGNLVNLTRLFLDTNQFSGSVPSSFSKLTKLTNFNCAIPVGLFPTLDFGNNCCTSGYATCSNGVITGLTLSGANLTGSLSPLLSGLTNVTSLDLSNNLQLSGPLPSGLSKVTSCNLSGTSLCSSGDTQAVCNAPACPSEGVSKTPLIGGLVGGAVLLIAGVVGFLWYRMRTQPEAEPQLPMTHKTSFSRLKFTPSPSPSFPSMGEAVNITEWWRPYDSACRTGIAAFDIAWRPFVVSWILVSALGCLFVTYCNVSMLRRNGWAVRGVRHMCLMAINGAALLKLVFYSYNPYCVYDGCDTNAVRILFDGTYWCFMLAYALMGVHWISIFYTFMHLTPIDTLLIARAVALVYVVFVVALEIVLSVMAMNTDLKYAVLIVEGGTLVLILLSVVPMYFLYGLRFIQRLRNVRADKSGRRERMLSKIRVMTYGPSVCSAVFIILQGAKFTVLHTNPFWFLIGECLGNSIEFIVMSLFLDGILLREPDAVPSLAERLWDITTAYVPLTYTSFGGPQVHIAMYIHEFVEKRKWLPSNVFAELFAIAQALPGPASTQLGYSIGLIRGGVAGGLLSFFIWSFPCMIIMMGFGIGVSQLGSSLPPVVLYLQNGLTSAAVGLVALAAYKLCTKLLADRICSAIGAVSAILAINLYKQAWLFPVLMIAGGTVTFIEAQIAAAAERRAREQAAISSSEARDEARALQPGSTADSGAQTPKSGSSGSGAADESTFFKVRFSYSPRTGLVLLGIWAVLLVVAIVLRGIDAPRPLSVLGTLYFVGSIIFGGGPVVIPLLQNYVVTNGWLSDSEFLIGLAIINAMPGPNFNIAAYVGALALRDSVGASIGGALLGNIGIFLPGLLLMSGLMPLWNQYRALKSVQSVFRGVNAAAVGLVVAAIYLLGQKTITPPHSSGLGIVEPLTDHPIYIGVAIFSYTASGFLGLPTPLAIILGGIFGIIHWGISR
nr:hypothetical protein HK105_005694 [Polyrhizophydium stewartii]